MMIIPITESKLYQEQKIRERQEFYNKYYDLPEPEPNECLDIVLKDKAEAYRILRGEQTAVFVKAIPFYDQYIIDDDVMRWYRKEVIKGTDKNWLLDNIQTLRYVESLHLHDWADTWYLDIEAICTGCMEVNRQNVKEVSKECKYDFSVFEEDLEFSDVVDADPTIREQFGVKPDEAFKPFCYYFYLGGDYDTNLLCGKPDNIQNI